jgi:hypothetical protein
MSSALESRDRWSRSAHQVGQLLLGELVPHPELDEQTGNGLGSGEPRSDLTVLRVRLLVAADVIGNTGSNRAQTSIRHSRTIITFGNPVQELSTQLKGSSINSEVKPPSGLMVRPTTA